MPEVIPGREPEELRRELLGSRARPPVPRSRSDLPRRVLAWAGLAVLGTAFVLTLLAVPDRGGQARLLRETDVGPTPAVRVPARPPGGHR